MTDFSPALKVGFFCTCCYHNLHTITFNKSKKWDSIQLIIGTTHHQILKTVCKNFKVLHHRILTYIWFWTYIFETMHKKITCRKIGSTGWSAFGRQSPGIRTGPPCIQDEKN